MSSTAVCLWRGACHKAAQVCFAALRVAGSTATVGGGVFGPICPGACGGYTALTAPCATGGAAAVTISSSRQQIVDDPHLAGHDSALGGGDCGQHVQGFVLNCRRNVQCRIHPLLLRCAGVREGVCVGSEGPFALQYIHSSASNTHTRRGAKTEDSNLDKTQYTQCTKMAQLNSSP